MTPERLIKISKYLSRHLRHSPERIGLQLDSAGWVAVDDLMRACAKNQMHFTRDELNLVVAENSKQRFSFSDDGQRIRASQGHSIEVDLQLDSQTPPDVLYHGTARQNLEIITREGLRPMRRHHAHLSRDVETARTVGARHGKPVVLEVDAKRLHESGTEFFVSDNGVWLADEVPPDALRVLESSTRLRSFNQPRAGANGLI